jgi:8-oxo-dGTP pyrophosphatase MutT (NUDIX family)
MELQTRYSAGLAIIYQGKLLLGKTAGRTNKKSYGIPKGGIDEGENKIDAAIRETQEELGIKVSKNLIGKDEFTFVVTSRKYKYNKVVYYYVVNIDNLKQLGLKSEKIPTGQFDTKEISAAEFFNYTDAKNVVMISQNNVVDVLMNKGLLESKTAGNNDVKPNIELNEVQPGIGEDPRLLKIRQFKATIKDYKSYWDDRIKGSN